MRRGQVLYIAHCAICHQVTGRGVTGVYPPLAGSDRLQGADGPGRVVRAIVAGVSGPLTVNGTAYDNRMPAVVLDDAQAADVATFVLNSWRNPGGRVDAAEVARLRRTTEFATFEALRAAHDYAPLPPAPEGFRIRELARLHDFAVRLTGDPAGRRLYLLGGGGDVSRLDPATGRITVLFRGASYLDPAHGPASTLGLMRDPAGRLWISANQRQDAGGPLVTNVVTIFRTAGTTADGDPAEPRPWFRTAYPYGIGPYNHGVSHLALGPDGRLYVSSGSRTDGGEPGGDPRLGRMGETAITATLWRMDPGAAEPMVEVVARGIRNAWSFAWDGAGRLFTVSNGPDAHSGEEMDHILPDADRHHGFPYQLADWPLEPLPYPHTPRAPDGIAFVHPVRNLGPAGIPPGAGGATFDPHSSPAGMVWLDEHWPAPWRNSFLVGRFGNLLAPPDGRDVGFDILSVRPIDRDGVWEATTGTFLNPLARPIDLHVAGGRIHVLEYTRPTDFRSGRGWLPGRVLELTPDNPSR